MISFKTLALSGGSVARISASDFKFIRSCLSSSKIFNAMPGRVGKLDDESQMSFMMLTLLVLTVSTLLLRRFQLN